jgi:hypothetical protein
VTGHSLSSSAPAASAEEAALSAVEPAVLQTVVGGAQAPYAQPPKDPLPPIDTSWYLFGGPGCGTPPPTPSGGLVHKP